MTKAHYLLKAFASVTELLGWFGMTWGPLDRSSLLLFLSGYSPALSSTPSRESECAGASSRRTPILPSLHTYTLTQTRDSASTSTWTSYIIEQHSSNSSTLRIFIYNRLSLAPACSNHASIVSRVGHDCFDHLGNAYSTCWPDHCDSRCTCEPAHRSSFQAILENSCACQLDHEQISNCQAYNDQLPTCPQKVREERQ